MTVGAQSPRDVDAFLTKDSCTHAMQEAKDLLDRALVQNENSELRRIRFYGCDSVFIPVPPPEVF